MTEFFNEPMGELYPHLTLNCEYLPQHFLHVLTPANLKNKTKFNPLIIFVANNNDQLHLIPLANLCSHGFTIAFISADQLSGELQQQVGTLKTAIRYLMLHASQFSIDTNRIFIWGEKTGAELAAATLLTLNDPEWNHEDPRILPLRFRAGILFGTTEYQKLISLIPTNRRPPLFLYNGEKDELNKNEQQQFIAKYQDLNSIEDFILNNVSSGCDAFFSPYLLTNVENQFRKFL